MTLSTELPFGILRPGPTWKQGYASHPHRDLATPRYVVYHSAEGYAPELWAELNRPNRRASWSASVLLDGTVWRHYPVESITWASGTKVANISGFAVEFEGKAGTPITDAQVRSGALIFDFLQSVCPNLGAPILGQGFEEHRRLTGGATSCPSDRIRWLAIADELEDHDMPLTDADKDAIRELVMQGIDKYLFTQDVDGAGNVRGLFPGKRDQFVEAITEIIEEETGG